MDPIQQPNMSNPISNPISPAPKESNIGGIIAIVIIVLLLVIGGVYFWMTKSSESTPAPIAPVVNTPAPATPTAKTSDLSKELDASANVDVSADMKNVDDNIK